METIVEYAIKIVFYAIAFVVFTFIDAWVVDTLFLNWGVFEAFTLMQWWSIAAAVTFMVSTPIGLSKISEV